MWARMQYDRWNVEAEARQQEMAQAQMAAKLVKEDNMKDVSPAKEKATKSPQKKENASEQTRSC